MDRQRQTQMRASGGCDGIRREEDSIVRERVANATLQGKGRNFWAEIKRIRGSRARASCQFDGLSDADDTVRLFAVKYRELYNSVSYDEAKMQAIINNNNCPTCNVVLILLGNHNDGSTKV